MNPIRHIAMFAAILCAISLAASAQTPAQPTRADAEKDPVLKAMLTELDRSKNQLQLKDVAKPFFIQYRIEEIDNFETKAQFGATTGSQHNHGRVARVTVRVGDYKTDSSGSQGDGAIQLAALDDDAIAMRTRCGSQPIRRIRTLWRLMRKSRPPSSRLKRRRRPTTSARRSRSSVSKNRCA